MVLFKGQGGRDSFQLRLEEWLPLHQSISIDESPWNFPIMNHHFKMVKATSVWVNLIMFHSPEIFGCLAIPGFGRCEVVIIYPAIFPMIKSPTGSITTRSSLALAISVSLKSRTETYGACVKTYIAGTVCFGGNIQWNPSSLGSSEVQVGFRVFTWKTPSETARSQDPKLPNTELQSTCRSTARSFGGLRRAIQIIQGLSGRKALLRYIQKRDQSLLYFFK
jgi:hypothetical protein